MILIEKLKSSEILKHLLVLITGSGLSQLLIVISSPILSRIYDSAAYGTYGTFMSVGVILSGLFGLRYELAVVLEQTFDRAITLARMILIINVLFFLIVSVGAYVLALNFEELFGHELEAKYVLFIGVFPFLSAVNNVYSFLFTKKADFKKLSLIQIVKSLLVVSSQLGLSYLLADFLGLLLGQFIGLGFSVLLSILLFGNFRALFLEKINRNLTKTLLTNHIKFPKFSMPQSLLNAASQNVPTIILSSSFGLEVAGLYWFTVRILQMPINVFGKSVRKIFLKRASDLFNEGRSFQRLFIRSTIGLFSLGALPTLVLFFYSTELFEVVFGSEWVEAGLYCKYLVIALALGALVNAPSNISIQILGFQSKLLTFDLFLLIARVIALFLGVFFDSSLLAIQLFALTGLIFNWGLISWTYYKINEMSRSLSM